MDQWRSHIPRNNLPKQFCERCFEQGDRKSQQKWLELVLELVFRVCVRKKECVGAGISGGGHRGPTRQGARPIGVGVPWTLVARCLLPCCVLSARYSQIFQKNHISISGHLENFYFRGIFYIARIIQKTDRKILFLLYFN